MESSSLASKEAGLEEYLLRNLFCMGAKLGPHIKDGTQAQTLREKGAEEDIWPKEVGAVRRN